MDDDVIEGEWRVIDDPDRHVRQAVALRTEAPFTPLPWLAMALIALVVLRGLGLH